jgi:hypothetical protein
VSRAIIAEAARRAENPNDANRENRQGVFWMKHLKLKHLKRGGTLSVKIAAFAAFFAFYLAALSPSTAHAAVSDTRMARHIASLLGEKF